MISGPWTGFETLTPIGPIKMYPSASDPLFWRIVTGGGLLDCATPWEAESRPPAISAIVATEGQKALWASPRTDPQRNVTMLFHEKTKLS